jgi:uncharacterized membrane protein YozB (DUF420 family)
MALQIRRFAFAMQVTVMMAVAAIIHLRVGVPHLYPLAHEFNGPFTPVVDSLEQIVPITIMIILLATWAWVFYSPVQQERRQRRVGP